MALENTPPLTMAEWLRTFQHMQSVSTHFKDMSRIAAKVINDNGYNNKPIAMLSVGPGRGNFEKQLVEELGLKLNYICAIEPNPELAGKLDTALKSLGSDYDILQSFFNKEFQFDSNRSANSNKSEKFDLILFINSLYGFEDPHGAVLHATNFLKPGGKMLIIHQGATATAAIFNYLVNRSDPEIFSPTKTIVDNSLTAEKIISQLKEGSSNLSILVMVEPCYEDVDDFVRRTDRPGCHDMISCSLNADYSRLSEEAREHIYQMVVDNCDVFEGKYFWKHEVIGIAVSFGV